MRSGAAKTLPALTIKVHAPQAHITRHRRISLAAGKYHVAHRHITATPTALLSPARADEKVSRTVFAQNFSFCILHLFALLYKNDRPKYDSRRLFLWWEPVFAKAPRVCNRAESADKCTGGGKRASNSFSTRPRTSSQTKQTPRTGLEGKYLKLPPSSSPCAALQSNSVSTEPSASAVSFGGGRFGCVGRSYTLIKLLQRSNAVKIRRFFVPIGELKTKRFKRRKQKNPRHETEKCFGTVYFVAFFASQKKPICGKPLAKSKELCYNIPRVPVFRLYRSAFNTFMQDCHTVNMAVCLFICIYIILQKMSFVNGFYKNIKNS